MSIEEILQNAYVITNGGERLEQFRRTFSAVGIDPAPIREWKACMAPEKDGIALGCSISHYSLVRYAREANLPWLVVFEDDAVPVDAAAEKVAQEFDAHRENGKTLCLSLGWNYDSDPDKGADRNARRRVYGTHAYILFGRPAYDAFMEAFTKNGSQIDITVDIMQGSAMAAENLFHQYSPTPSMHTGGGSWTVDAEIERIVNREAGSKLAKARAEVEKMKREKAIHVAYCIDVQGQGAAQFCDQLFVSAKSLRDTRAPGDTIICHVFYANVPVELMENLHRLETDGFKVETRKIADSDLAYWQQFTKHNPRSAARPWGGIVFARIWLPLLLPGCDRCIYLDADTMCRAPISELWAKEIPEGAVLGMNMGSVPEYGYNSGVMLMDLKSMREDKDMYKRLGEFMAKNTIGFYCPDQTTINRFFVCKIFDIGREWNYPPTPGCADPEMGKAKLWHFYNGHQKPYRLAADDAGRALVEWNNMLSNRQ